MKLLRQAILKSLPALYETEGVDIDNKKIITKFFCPWNHWTWYGIEFDGEDVFFGYVVGDYNELGYFNLSELSGAKGPFGLNIERDLYFSPKRLSEIKKLSTEG